ncbi:hypothetical protein TSOC_003940 [Tetrabaena socialis]|uniref:Uncharacterized protein n=1 Tax=Tetrabaena socialis TaxID=47790 RepID=A0A2J8AA70_9CHLO|nr:hypothetical protein TSOC_003940 [Tetrabaena socialis]|eukprot:PNH09419.1 hypothetical protein TSOC_003940 [Tetrabaena socialis]
MVLFVVLLVCSLHLFREASSQLQNVNGSVVIQGTYIGWLGHGNLGDELVEETFVRLMRMVLQDISRGCLHSDDVNVSCPAIGSKKMHFGVLGGGSLLYSQYVKHLKVRGVGRVFKKQPVLLFGTGAQCSHCISKVQPDYLNFDLIMALYRMADFVLAQRLHPAILAASAGTPFLIHGSNMKMLDASTSIGAQHLFFESSSKHALTQVGMRIAEWASWTDGKARQAISFQLQQHARAAFSMHHAQMQTWLLQVQVMLGQCGQSALCCKEGQLKVQRDNREGSVESRRIQIVC